MCRHLQRPIGWPAWRRPARLLSRPEPLSNVMALLPDHPPRRFTWRGEVHEVVRGDGPERIYGEWWVRDGEIFGGARLLPVEDRDGGRFWVFRRGDGVDAADGRPDLVDARRVRMTSYVELQVTTPFQLPARRLHARGAVRRRRAARTYGARRRRLGSVAGMVRGWEAQKATGVRLIAGRAAGARRRPQPAALSDRSRRLVADDPAADGRQDACRQGRLRPRLGRRRRACRRPDRDPACPTAGRRRWRATSPSCAHCSATAPICALTLPPPARRHGSRCTRLPSRRARAGVRAVATGDVLYHAPEARLLQDVVTAIREKTTIDALGFRRERHADRHLKSPEEMERRFAAFPDAIAATAEIAGAARSISASSAINIPHEQVIAGLTAQQALERLTARGGRADVPGRRAAGAIADQIDHELELIGELGYAPYFLTVNSIVAESRRRGILCQGRGSAANSCVCFVLGITSIDPIKHELLFERFVSGERARAARHRRRFRA